MTDTRESLFAGEALVELQRTVNVKFDVQKIIDEFPSEWEEWCQECDGEPTERDVREFVSETVAEMGWDILSFNDWVIPEPMYDDEGTDVRWKS